MIHTETVLVIVGMALVTYATRAGGVWMMSRVKPSPFVQAWMRHVPGAVLVAIVAPATLSRGPADAAAALIATLVALRTRSMILTICVGVLAVVLLRQAFP